MSQTTINKGFIKDWLGNTVLPITRGELVLDVDGNVALTSKHFLAGENGNTYGLITAAERAMLNTEIGGGGSVGDLYVRVENINEGLKVGGTNIRFYDSNLNSTPINLVSTGEGSISVGIGANNTISFALATLTTSGLSSSDFIRSITVDKYGRVTNVSGSALTNADIPQELTEKNLKNSTLEGCTTADSDIGTDDKAIVNKAYVDAKFREVSGVASGALRFIGAVGDATTANNALSNKDYWNAYYIVNNPFSISTSDLYDTAGIIGTTVSLKIGDTLIIYSDSETATKAKFVYVPSANEDVTSITVKGDRESSNALTSKVGPVTLRFSDVFSVTNPQSGSGTAYISLPEAGENTDGYLSKEDWALFNSYASDLASSYTGEFSTGAGVYKIGTLTFGSVDEIIYGINNISELTLNNGSASGANQAYNPILTFKETGISDVNITFKGVNGITTKKNGNNIEIAAANELATGADKYLTLDSGYKFGIKVGSLNGNTLTDGITDYEEFATFRSNILAKTTIFELIENSLHDTTQTYYYGSTELKTAVAVTI